MTSNHVNKDTILGSNQSFGLKGDLDTLVQQNMGILEHVSRTIQPTIDTTNISVIKILQGQMSKDYSLLR